jgi:hypothetical protein
MRVGAAGGLLALALAAGPSLAGEPGAGATAAAPVRIEVGWDAALGPLRTQPTVQVVANRLVRRGSPVHDAAFRRLRELGCRDARFIAWHPHPRLAVPALEAPAGGRTSWDFSELDPIVADFMAAMQGRPVIVNFSALPQWLFRTPARVPYPDDPTAQSWSYLQGTELRDPGLGELTGYFARIAAWYAAGGFVDEAGETHRSGHEYRFDAWEVLNEPNAEHQMTGAEYVRRYDAIVDAVRRVSPATRFVGPALVFPFHQERFMKTFLKPTHHRPGVPIDMMSYHFYVSTSHDTLVAGCPAPAFAEVDRGVRGARRLERLRARLRPAAGTAVTESGTVAVEDLAQWRPGYVYEPIPDTYWRLSAAVYAYIVSRLAELGVDVVAESALAQFPGEFASVTLLDWETGEPNARYWVLKALCDGLRDGGTLVRAASGSAAIHARAWRTGDGRRRLLLVNTCDAPVHLALDAPPGARWTVVDDAHAPPRTEALAAGTGPVLGGLGVAVVELPAG